MSTTLDFDSFYNDTLLPSMDSLKEECRQSDSWGITALVSLLLAVGVLILLGTGSIHTDSLLPLIFFPVVLLIVSLYFYTKSKDNFTEDYKKLVIKKMVEYVDPSFTYNSGGTVSAQEYVNSSLVRYRYAYSTGEDYIEGVYNNVSFHCSDITTETDQDKKIFNGLFLVAKINEAYACGTYIWTKGFEQLPASLMDEYYRLLPMPEVYDVTIDDADFKKYFRVCSTYSAEATGILDSSRRNGMMNLIEYMNRPIGISFVMGYCYVAVPFEEDILDAGDYYPDEKEVLKAHFAILTLIPKILEELKLFDLQ